MSIKHFIAFLGLTFLISWGIPGTGLLLSRLYSGFPFRLDMYSPLYYAGVWGPPVAAILVIGYVQGLKGLAAFLRRLLDWRFPVRWWVFAVLGIPLLYFLAAVGHWLTDTPGAMTGWNLSVAYFLGSTLARASAGPVPGQWKSWDGEASPFPSCNADYIPGP